MHIQPDFEELLRLLEDSEAEYLIVGGYAVAFHGYPRLTKDINIFYNCSLQNAKKVRNALVQFGFPPHDVGIELFAAKGNILTFGVEPVRVDFINEIAGIEFANAWTNRIRGEYGDVMVNFIGRRDLITNKLSTPRAKDKADAEELSQLSP
jgi:hypothetical protein